MRIMLALIMSACLSVTGGVEVSSSGREVFANGTSESIGSVSLDIDDSSFRETGIIVTVSLSNNAVLAKTLVDMGSEDLNVNQPVNLPVRESRMTGTEVVADVDAVQIVRYVQGESRVWLRFNQSSDEWLQNANGLTGPSNNNVVTIGVGVDGSYICADLSNSTLVPDGTANARMSVDMTSYMTGDPENNVLGDHSNISFSGIPAIVANAKSRSCDIGVYGLDYPGNAPVCTEENALPSLITVQRPFVVSLDCFSAGSYIQTYFGPGSSVVLTAKGNYGFNPAMFPGFVSANGEPNVVSLAGHTTGVEGTEFDVLDDEVTLYRSVVVSYTGSAVLSNPTFAVVIPVYMERTGEANVEVDLSVNLQSYNNTRCGTSDYTLTYGALEVGTFDECAGTTDTLSVSYIPKVRGNTDFWAAFAVTNFSEHTVNITAVLYTGGVKVEVPLGDHPSNLVSTWVFDMLGSNTLSLRSSELNRVVPVGDFGYERMGVKVYGEFKAQYTDQLDDGDLDMYMLIGSGANVNGAYLARKSE